MAQWVMTWCCHCSGSGSIPSLFRMPQVQEKKINTQKWLLPASAEWWASLRTTGTRTTRPGQEKALPKEAKVWAGMPHFQQWQCPPPQIHIPCWGRHQELPGLLLGLRVLHTDYWCCVQRIQQQSDPYQSPWWRAALSLLTAHQTNSGRSPTTLPVGHKKGRQVDSWRGRGFKQRAIKENWEEIWWRKKNAKISSFLEKQFQQGQFPAWSVSRSAQCGWEDGCMLKGKEQEFYLRKIQA